MPGAHSYLQYILTYKFYTKPWPRINGLCRKKKSESKTGARAATAGPCCSCQQDSLAACKLLFGTILAHMEMNRGQSKMNRGNDEKGSGHGMAKASRQANTACRTRPLQANTAGRQPDRHRPQKNNNGQQLAGLAAKQQPRMLAGLSPCSAGRWRECGGAGHS